MTGDFCVEPQRQPINIVYPSRRFVSARVRSMVDFLQAEFLSDPTITPT